MPISQNDVLKTAHLARINLTEQEVKLFASQMEDILGFIDQLKQVDISNVKPTSHILGTKNILRADNPAKSLNKEAVLKNAPESAKGHFKVPKVIE